MQKALYLGRFQPLHRGHWWMIEEAMKQYDLVLAVGSSEAPQEFANPFSAEERREMLKRMFEASQIPVPTIHAVPDIPDDFSYVQHVIDTVGPVDIILSAEQDWTRDLFALQGYQIVYMGRHENISATMVRNCIASGQSWEQFVPMPVAEYIREIGGEQRIVRLHRQEFHS